MIRFGSRPRTWHGLHNTLPFATGLLTPGAHATIDDVRRAELEPRDLRTGQSAAVGRALYLVDTRAVRLAAAVIVTLCRAELCLAASRSSGCFDASPRNSSCETLSRRPRLLHC